MKNLIVLPTIPIAFVGGCFFDGIITHDPKEARTSGIVSAIERSIRKYYANTGKLPKSLQDLQAVPGDRVDFHNAWNGPIHYIQENDTTVLLTTYGPNGGLGPVLQRFVRRSSVGEGHRCEHLAEHLLDIQDAKVRIPTPRQKPN